jgi:hypothetical protein
MDGSALLYSTKTKFAGIGTVNSERFRWNGLCCILLIGEIILGFAAGTKAATEQEIWTGSDERIEQHRKVNAIVRITTRTGKPVPQARVRVEQVRHAFVFNVEGRP